MPSLRAGEGDPTVVTKSGLPATGPGEGCVQLLLLLFVSPAVVVTQVIGGNGVGETAVGVTGKLKVLLAPLLSGPGLVQVTV